MIRLLAHPLSPLFFYKVVSLSQSSEGRGRGGGREVNSYDRENAWPSTNRSILSRYITFWHYFQDSVVKKTMFLLLLESAPSLPSCLSPANIGKTSPYHTRRRKAWIEEREVAQYRYIIVMAKLR
jgi:hypothetical protein